MSKERLEAFLWFLFGLALCATAIIIVALVVTHQH